MSISFFVEMAWKSALIAGVTLLLAAALKSRSAADRAAVLQMGIGLLVLLPLVALLLPALQIETNMADAQPAATALIDEPGAASAAAGSPVISPEPSLLSDFAPLVAILYLGGLLMAGFHLAAGIVTLRRWTAAADPVTCPAWTSALKRAREAAGVGEVSLRVSAEAQAPLSWGWRKTFILIDTDAHKRAQDADAILAHEIAHLARRDWPALMLSRIAAGLFWFNPLVRLLERELVRATEEAADGHALARIAPADYAQALVSCARGTAEKPVPANSIASADLTRRIRAVLEGRVSSLPAGSRLAVAAVLICAAVAAPVAAMKLVPAKPAAPVAQLIPAEPALPVEAAARAAPVPATEAAPVRLVSPGSPVLAAAAAPAQPAAPAQRMAPAAQAPRVVVVDVDSELEEAMRVVEAAAADAARAGERAARAGERAARESRRAAAVAQRQAAQSMANASIDMERGADEMVRGAAEMAEEAAKLRDPAYREKQIAREAARGRTVTHQQLIDAIPELLKGSAEMAQGAEEMRRGAAEMRRQPSR